MEDGPYNTQNKILALKKRIKIIKATFSSFDFEILTNSGQKR